MGYLRGLQVMLWSEALSRKPCFRTQLIGTISSDWASQTTFTFAWEYISPAGLRIRDILLWIRIRESVPLTSGSGSSSGSGSWSCYFWLSWWQFKIFLFVFLLITFWSYIYIIFQKLKKSERSPETVGIKVFFLLDYRRFRNRIHISNNGSGSGRPKNIWILRIRIRNTAYM